MDQENFEHISSEEYNDLIKLAENYQPYVPVHKRRQPDTSKNVILPEKKFKEAPSSDIVGSFTVKELEPVNEQIIVNEVAVVASKDEPPMLTPKNWSRPLTTSWQPPSYCLNLNDSQQDLIRKKFNISITGKNIPCPLTSFKEMKINKAITKSLRNKNIVSPTSFQIQALPVVLSGRDLIGIAPTGCGKTLVLTIPLVMFCIEQEYELPFKHNEGPFALVLLPSRDLARQTFENIEYLTAKITEKGLPTLRNILCIGGAPMREQIEEIRKGSHCIVATPGRLLDLIKKNTLNLSVCRMVFIDEADRMLDAGFEQELRLIYDNIEFQTQTVLLSSTMPRRISDIVRSVLVDPITVIAGRSGTNNLNIIQEIELTPDDSRISNLIRCIKKTPPPVIIFATRRSDVEAIAEYLKYKEIDTLFIHGETSPQDKNLSLKLFRNNSIGVLVLTDNASKAIELPMVKHVINFDTPADIEAYIHRISRTGRFGRTGLATTFLSKSCDENFLAELRNVLIEAKQKIPQFLMDLKFDSTYTELKYHCTNCGPSNHSINGCPKNELKQKQSFH